MHELSAFTGSQRTCKRQLALFNARRRARYAVARASTAVTTGGEREAAEAFTEQPDAASTGTRRSSKKRRPTRTGARTRTRTAAPATTESRSGSGGGLEDEDKQFEETLARAFGDGSCCTEHNDGMARADPCAAAVSTATVDAEQAQLLAPFGALPLPFWEGSVVPHAMAPADATLLWWSQLCAPARAEPA